MSERGSHGGPICRPEVDGATETYRISQWRIQGGERMGYQVVLQLGGRSSLGRQGRGGGGGRMALPDLDTPIPDSPQNALTWCKCLKGAVLCRCPQQPQPQLQHDHRGAAGVLAKGEALLEARQAALRGRVRPHRGEKSLQVCGKIRRGWCALHHLPPNPGRVGGASAFPTVTWAQRPWTHRVLTETGFKKQDFALGFV